MIVTLIYVFLFLIIVRLFSNKNEKEINKGKCKYCDMVFDQEERLRRHIRKAHNERNSDMPNLNPFGN